MIHDGTSVLSYDANGNLMTGGYVWDRANRLALFGGITYAYDGLNNRVSQDDGVDATHYLLDLGRGLTQIVAETTGANTDRFIHSARGVHAHHDGSAWQYYMQDALGSIRGVIDASATIQQTINYSDYGTPDTSLTGFGFTGEQTDDSGLLYLRARYYDPSIGVFPSLDPFEGMMGRPMSLNGYSWVEGNPVMNVDPSGKQPPAPAPPIPWEDILTDIRQNYDRRLAERDLRWELERRGISPSQNVMRQAITRLQAAGVVVILSSTLLPDQQPNGLICNTWEYVLGTCHPIWDNPETYQNLVPQQLNPFPQIITDVDCLVLPLTQISVPPYINPPQVDTETEMQHPFDYHIAFGLARFGSQNDIIGAPALDAFVGKLNEKFPGLRRFPKVMYDRQWWQDHRFPYGEDPLSSVSTFPQSFNEATSDPRVSEIHFNIEGIMDLITALNEGVTNLREFAYYNGNGGGDYYHFGAQITVAGRNHRFIVTAWELARISSNSELCNKTSFYQQGTQDVTEPDESLKNEICNMSL